MNAELQSEAPPCDGADAPALLARGQLPPGVKAAIWRGSDLGASTAPTIPSGHDELDALLPGGGWPTRSLVELLQPQPALIEWRLLAPALRATSAAGREIVVVGPPKAPHLPGLR